MAQKIPATVVTGFLGAGKTTLIRHLLANANGARIALIINEFGDLGVDGDILKGCGIEGCADDDVVELSNGCICCTVAEDFVPTLQKLIDRDTPPDHIVIETSGLALPQPLVRAFNWPDIRGRVTVDGVVTVVDAPAVQAGHFAQDTAAIDAQRKQDDALDHETPLSELFADQMSCADMIVVNKTDLIDEDALTGLLDKLSAEARPGVAFVKAQMGAVGPDVLLGLGVGSEDDIANRPTLHEAQHHAHEDHHDHAHAEGHSHDHTHEHGHTHDRKDDHHHEPHHHHHDHGHDAFESFVVSLPAVANPTAFAERVAEVIRANNILRLKGFAAIEGKPMRLVIQAVGPRVDTHFDRPFTSEEPRETRLVVIGQAGLDRDAIAAALRA